MKLPAFTIRHHLKPLCHPWTCLICLLPAGTVSEPFFPRRPDGSIMWDRSGGDPDWDPDGMTLRVSEAAVGHG